MLGHNTSRAVAKKEDVAAAHLPEVQSSIVDGCCILRGHERLEAGQIRQQLRRPRQCDLAQLLRILEGKN